MPKCEHGLTSKECYVCASPKHAEQAEKQEPFGYFQYAMHFDAWVQNRDSNKGVAFYTAPQPQREWVGLTDEERNAVRNSVAYNMMAMTVAEWTQAVQHATEAKLREKNDG